MLRALQNELTLDNGVASLNSMPFSGLAFETDDARGEVHINIYDVRITCKVIVNWKSYSNGESGGGFKPLDIEQKYATIRLLTSDTFPDYAQEQDAVFDDGSPLTGIIYKIYPQGGWGARMYTAGNEDLQFVWHANGTLGYAVGHGPVREILSWDENGFWKECYISSMGVSSPAFRIELQADQCVSVLVMRNWEAAVFDPRRLTSYRCAEKFEDILMFRAAQTCGIWVDSDFIKEIPLVLTSGFFDSTEIVHWNGNEFDDNVAVLLEHLSRKRLKEVELRSYTPRSAECALKLRQKLPNVNVISCALNDLEANKHKGL